MPELPRLTRAQRLTLQLLHNATNGVTAKLDDAAETVATMCNHEATPDVCRICALEPLIGELPALWREFRNALDKHLAEG